MHATALPRPQESQTRVDFVLLADHAEVTSAGKLYVLGGGWNRIGRPVPLALPGVSEPPPPPPLHIAVVTSILVDWNETNETLPLEITIEKVGEPPKPPIVTIQGRLEVGRPPAVIRGRPIRTIMAHPLTVNLSEDGEHVVRARLTDRDPGPQSERSEAFDVASVPMVVAPPQPPS